MVSVLFADLVGYTRRSERLDVEDVERFLAPVQAALRLCVERTGGEVAKFTGDGVMAVFGASVAHEDDAERAVRCGLAIREAVSGAAEGADHATPLIVPAWGRRLCRRPAPPVRIIRTCELANETRISHNAIGRDAAALAAESLGPAVRCGRTERRTAIPCMALGRPPDTPSSDLPSYVLQLRGTVTRTG